jgi:hypothetical protein
MAATKAIGQVVERASISSKLAQLTVVERPWDISIPRSSNRDVATGGNVESQKVSRKEFRSPCPSPSRWTGRANGG